MKSADTSFRVQFVRDGEPFETGDIRLEELNDQYRVTLKVGSHTFAEAAEDYFEAFCNIRRTLEPFGIYAACLGATLQVFPSGMSRSMGGGVKAYRLSLGCQAKTTDLVHIFDPVTDEQPCTVHEQEDFFDQWLKSL